MGYHEAMETEETRQLVLRFLDARSANDTEAMAALLTEDATWYPPKSEYDNEYAWVYTCRDGKIYRLDEFADTLRAGRAFGWVKS